MDIEMLSQFFLWCSIINIGLSLLLFLALIVAKNKIYEIHGRLFNVPKEKVAETMHSAMLNYKTIIFIFNVIPYIALQIIK